MNPIRRLVLEPEQTIWTVGHTRMAVLDGMRHGRLEIDCSAVRKHDASFLLLLASVKRQAVERKQILKVHVPPATPLAQALADAGVTAASLSVAAAE